MTSDVSTANVIDEVLANGGLGFADVAKMRSAHRGAGKTLNPATPFRWHTKGVKRPDGSVVRLEAARFGGKFLTSEAAVRRFISALSEPIATTPAPRSPAARQRASEEAAKQLEALGA